MLFPQSFDPTVRLTENVFEATIIILLWNHLSSILHFADLGFFSLSS